jgi:hypothetical protein
MNKKILIGSLIVFLGLSVAVFQYVREFNYEFVRAYSTSKPANGHSWSEMECTAGLCVTTDNKVGVGTDSPSKKLEVNGDILASGTGDVCNGTGKCLSSVFQTNVIAGTNPTCPSGQIAIMKASGGTWYTASQVGSWTQVACGQLLSSDGTPLLVNSQHTTGNCASSGGTVIGDGSGNNMCRFNSSSCPGGWTRYGGWSTTNANTVNSPAGGCSGWFSCGSCSFSTGGHGWSNNGTVESATSCMVAWHDATCEGGCNASNQHCACYNYGSNGGSCLGGTQESHCSSGSASVTQVGCY